MKRLLHNKPLKFLSQLALGSVALTLGATSANALPGQDIAAIRTWTENSSMLPALQYNRDVNAYTGIRTIPKGNLALFVKLRPENKTSVQEQIIAQVNAPELAFARDNAKGLEMIEQIYSFQIADDFRGSKYVARINSPQVGSQDFYQGDRFIYITSQDPQRGIRRLQLIPVSQLREAIAQAKYCQTHTCFSYEPFSVMGVDRNTF